MSLNFNWSLKSRYNFIMLLKTIYSAYVDILKNVIAFGRLSDVLWILRFGPAYSYQL